MAYDDVIRAMGEFGPHQRRILLLLYLPMITCALQTMVEVFLAAETDFRCLLPHESRENATYRLSQNLTSLYYPTINGTENHSQCERYDVDLTDQFHDSNENITATGSIVKCDSFVYDKTTYELTVITEFDLVCENAWLKATADSQFFLGLMLGAIIFSVLSDMYGRKPIFCLSIFCQAFCGLLVAVAPEIISYMIFRVLAGSAVAGVSLISYVIVVEMVVPERRLLVGVGTELVYSLGVILTAVFAYFISNWRILQIAITVPNFAFLVYWWFMPESGRWLLTMGRLKEAEDLFHKASLENGKELSPDRLGCMLSDSTATATDLEESSVFDLLRYPNLRRKSLLIFFIWFMNNLTYYGLTWNTSSLVGNPYLNFAISGFVEIPANVFILFIVNRFGRRIILCSTLFLGGIPLFLRIFVPEDIAWLEIVLTMIARSGIVASFSTMYVFAGEQLPTVIRSAGMGVGSTCGTLGGLVSPYIEYASGVWKPLPLVIFGFGSLIAGLSTLLLPETSNEKLPETIQDGEQFGKKSVKSDNTSSN